MTVFEQAKSAIDMRTAAEGYGLHINRSRMCLCPFHDEHKPSAKIYSDSFHCFGCREHHDVISFTQKLFSLGKPIKAVKKLNEDFGLHIDFGKGPTTAEVPEYQKRVAERQAYEEWESSAWDTLNRYCWLMREWRELAPHTPDDVCDERFVYALYHLDYAEHLCGEFIAEPKAFLIVRIGCQKYFGVTGGTPQVIRLSELFGLPISISLQANSSVRTFT